METPEWLRMGSDGRVPAAGVWLKLGYRRIALLMLHVQMAQGACRRAAATQLPAAQQCLVRAREELAEALRTDC